MSEDMTNEKDSVDGIESDLFPLTYHQTAQVYVRLDGGVQEYRGHQVWKVAFEPKRHASILDGDDGGNAM